MAKRQVKQVAATVSEGISKTFERTLTGTKEIFTDLFKLLPEQVIKYEGWDEINEHPDTHPNKFSFWEHTHPFRTYDKKGSKQVYSTPIAGHFHVIDWTEDAEGKPVIKSVSGPMVMGTVTERGRKFKAPVPANEYDVHTHDVEYLRSSKIEFSQTNIEASKVIAFEAQKGAPVPGVVER